MQTINARTSALHLPSIAPIIYGGTILSSVLPSASAGTSLCFNLPTFDAKLEVPLADQPRIDVPNQVLIEARVDEDVVVELTLHGEMADAKRLRVDAVDLEMKFATNKARAHFVCKSLWALLSLAGDIRISIPEVGFDFGIQVDVLPKEVSILLQNAQTAYSLMVIERATSLPLEIPKQVTAEDEASISFTYYAITEREFLWPTSAVMGEASAPEEKVLLALEIPAVTPRAYTFTVKDPESRTIFGREVVLGPKTISVSNGVIQNVQEIRRELAYEDGRKIPVVVRPLDGLATFSFPQAPRLTAGPWDTIVALFIKLEDQMNRHLADRYNKLVASTLAGFTSEEAAVITARPALGEDAHLVGD